MSTLYLVGGVAGVAGFFVWLSLWWRGRDAARAAKAESRNDDLEAAIRGDAKADDIERQMTEQVRAPMDLEKRFRDGDL